jgi:hypothetical protein
MFRERNADYLRADLNKYKASHRHEYEVMSMPPTPSSCSPSTSNACVPISIPKAKPKRRSPISNPHPRRLLPSSSPSPFQTEEEEEAAAVQSTLHPPTSLPPTKYQGKYKPEYTRTRAPQESGRMGESEVSLGIVLRSSYLIDFSQCGSGFSSGSMRDSVPLYIYVCNILTCSDYSKNDFIQGLIGSRMLLKGI